MDVIRFLYTRWTRSSRSARGFTLIELLVVTAILVLLSGLMLASNTRFGGVIQLESLAYDIGLSIRQAQVYGISVKQSTTGVYTAGYGMSFDVSTQGGRTSYVLFGDTVSGNGLYDANLNGESELVLSNTISRGYQIRDLCVTTPAVSGNPATEECGKLRVDVFFKRPEPDAYIASDQGTPENPTTLMRSCATNNGSGVMCYESARIVVQSPRGDTMSITVGVNGQVSVSRP